MKLIQLLSSRNSFLALVLLSAIVNFITSSASVYVPACRDPDLGGQSLIPSSDGSKAAIDLPRKFLLIGGAGAGIGNFIVFYPAAYYFAALTGREILIMDDSLIGEMCSVLQCGFPHYSDTVAAYPSLLHNQKVKLMKVYDFHRHINNELVADDVVIQACGFMALSGWYLGRNHSEICVPLLTGCGKEDVSCHDRHALQRLVRGPFKDSAISSLESRIHGAPHNLKHAILKLPHSYSPRLDAAVHLRCQFKYFEQLIGPEDGALWVEGIKELHDWMNSTKPNQGVQLFRTVADKIVEQLPGILQNSQKSRKLHEQKLRNFMKQEKRRKLQNSEKNRETEIEDMNLKEFEQNVSAKKSRKNARKLKSESGFLTDIEENEIQYVRDYLRIRKLLPENEEEEIEQGNRNNINDENNRNLKYSVNKSNSQKKKSVKRRTEEIEKTQEKAQEEIKEEEKEKIEMKINEETFSGVHSNSEKIFVYIASDNEIVKEAFADYMTGYHPQIRVMRVKNEGRIHHAKNTEYLKSAGNNTGVQDLVLDWYALSLSNIVIAWRKDTDMLSTYAQSAQKMTGHTETSLASEHKILHGKGSSGFQLTNNGWHTF